MPHTYVSELIHCVFSTKGRRNLIPEEVQPDLWAFIGGVARKNGVEFDPKYVWGWVQASLRDAVQDSASLPGVETPGYCQASCGRGGVKSGRTTDRGLLLRLQRLAGVLRARTVSIAWILADYRNTQNAGNDAQQSPEDTHVQERSPDTLAPGKSGPAHKTANPMNQNPTPVETGLPPVTFIRLSDCNSNPVRVS
ncbi:MAG TPA: hypothetical protein VJ999_02325 [Candidatus Sulfotelmatobacter sp.]|nr:hypothetical protein [Candidatus Sulfotelmatobacter sp.]